MSFPRRRESINLKERVATARLFVGATLCGRPKTTIVKWQLIIKNSSTQRGEDKGEGEVGKSNNLRFTI